MVKMAYCIMDRKYKILESVTLSIKPENTTSKKRTMIEYEMGIIANLNAMIDDIIFRFNPNQFIIEL